MTTAHCLDNMSGFEFKKMHKSMILKDKLTTLRSLMKEEALIIG